MAFSRTCRLQGQDQGQGLELQGEGQGQELQNVSSRPKTSSRTPPLDSVLILSHKNVNCLQTMLNFLFTLMKKSVDFETRECSRDGGSASPTSQGVEMITHLDVDTALKCCQMK